MLVSVMEKVLVIKFIIVASAAAAAAAATAAAAAAAAVGDVSKGGSLDANDLSNSKTVFLPVSENEIAFNQRESMAERKKGCSPKPSCTKAGGVCVKSQKDCIGTVDSNGCKGGKKCMCCIPDQSTPAPPTTMPMGCPDCTCPAVTCPAVTYSPSTEGGCAGVIVGHQCLSFSSEELNWNKAKQACVSRGGHLAIPANPNELLDYVIQQYGRGAVRLWIGGSDIANEGTWLWLDGRPMSSFPWGSGQPDNWNGNENCLEVNFDGGYNDEACTNKRRYICEL